MYHVLRDLANYMRGRGCEGGGLSYLFEGVNEVKTMWLGSLVTRNQGSVLMHAQVIKLRLVTKYNIKVINEF